MANKATITYNGKDVLTEEKEGNFDVLYKENVIATLGAGQSKTLFCKNKVMRSDIKIGSKTLFCKAKKMYSDIKIMVESLFPPNPSSYDLIATYTSSQTWTAPESGWFQIEAMGASGRGGRSYAYMYKNDAYGITGGGGGGGGYACSRVKLNKGDTVVLTVGAVGATTSAAINSSIETYSPLQVASGGNGTDESGMGVLGSPGKGGTGGTASGGNYSNVNGSAGEDGLDKSQLSGYGHHYVLGGAGANGAPNGGNCWRIVYNNNGAFTDDEYYYDEYREGIAGSPGFFKIYHGNTN